MAFRLNQDGGEAGKTEDSAGAEVSRDCNNFQGKKGSVFPVKRKLVKTMMIESLVKSISSPSISPEEASLSTKQVGGSSKISTPSTFNSPRGKKRMTTLD